MPFNHLKLISISILLPLLLTSFQSASLYAIPIVLILMSVFFVLIVFTFCSLIRERPASVGKYLSSTLAASLRLKVSSLISKGEIPFFFKDCSMRVISLRILMIYGQVVRIETFLKHGVCEESLVAL